MAKRRSYLSRMAVCLAAGVLTVAVSVALRVVDPAPVSALRSLTFDFFQRLSPREYSDVPVRIVDIDDQSLAELGQWPWPRTQLAALVSRLTDLGAAAIALDIILAEPDRTSPAQIIETLNLSEDAHRKQVSDLLAGLPDHDATLAAALRQGPVVLGYTSTDQANNRRPPVKGGFAFAGANPTEVLPPFRGAITNLPVLDEAARGSGNLSMGSEGASGVTRRLPLVFSDGSRTYFGLSLEALRIAQGAATITVRSTGASGESDGGRAALVDLKAGDFRVPLTAEGELVLHYDRNRPERYVSARDVLDASRTEALRPRLEGQIVFVGTSAAGLLDQRVTALGEVVAGVSIHAQAAEQILAQDFLLRPDWATGLELVATTMLAFVVSLLLLVLGARWAATVIVGAIVAILGGTWLAFTEWKMLLDPVFPVMSAVTLYFIITAVLYFTTDRDKRFVREAFGRYLAPELLAELENSPDKLKLGGELRDMTILFMDIRDFTPISERLSAEELIEFLNTLFTPLTEAIQGERGTVDKYIGDSIMAFWNAPVDVPDHAARACAAALKMIAIVDHMNREDAFGFAARGFADLKVKIGIGLNTGEACVGNMGSESRFNYSVVGDAVNTASRIESSCKAVGASLLLSENTLNQAGALAALEAGEVALKGKSSAMKLFALFGDRKVAAEAGFRKLGAEHGRLLAALRAGDQSESLEALLNCRVLGGQQTAQFYEVFSQQVRALPRARERKR